VDEWLREHLVCPRDEQPLSEGNGFLVCTEGHTYPYVNGIPIMLTPELPDTHWIATYSLEHLHDEEPSVPVDGIDAFVREAVAATCGNLYARVGATMNRYPIPHFPVNARTKEEPLLEIGCNWGRWCFSAARRGFRVVGIDPSLPGIRAAHRVAERLGITASFVVADARRLPFRRRTFETIFSYSVLQHFSPADFRRTIAEAARVTADNGRVILQMPNRFGVRNLFQQIRTGFAAPQRFEVRYWSPTALLREIASTIGPAHLEVDGYFSLNAQTSDLDLLPNRYRAIVRLSDWLRRMSDRNPVLIYLADSLYVHGRRSAGL